MRHTVTHSSTTNVKKQDSRKAAPDKLVTAYQNFLTHGEGRKFPVFVLNPSSEKLCFKNPYISVTIDGEGNRSCKDEGGSVDKCNEIINSLGLSVTKNSNNTYTDFNIPGEHNNPINSFTIVRNNDYPQRCVAYAELLDYDIAIVVYREIDTYDINVNWDSILFIPSNEIGVSMYPCNALNTYPDKVTTFVTRFRLNTYTKKANKPTGTNILEMQNYVQLPVNII